MADPTKLDHTLARKKTQKAADEAPLLALLGMTPVFTAEAQAQRREDAQEAAAANFDASIAKWTRDIEECRVEILGLVGMVALLDFEAYLEEGTLLRTCGLSTRWSFWVTARTRAQRGEPMFERWTPGLAKPRVHVEPEDAMAVLVRLVAARGGFPVGCKSITDELPDDPGVLDVSAALNALRDAGRIQAVEVKGRFKGWIPTSP